MGLQLPARTGSTRRTRRLSLLALSSLGLVLLTGCSGEGERFAMPEPATEQGEHILSLWQGAWIAALITGVLVWGLIFYAAWRFHRRSDDEIPIQTRYNLPLEIFYTIFPVIMVIVFFAHTVDVQNDVLDDEGEPDHTITVVGQQWSWTFNYPHESDEGAWVWEGGTAAIIPTLVIPVGETTEFKLVSRRRHPRLRRARLPDEDGRDAGPGQQLPGHADGDRRPTRASATSSAASPTRGCCSTSRSSSRTSTKTHLEELAEAGNASEDPLIGGEFVREQAGLEAEHEGGVRVTATASPSTEVTGRKPLGQQVVRVLTTTDHKVIGNLYLVTSFAWFLIAGLMAMLMRSELAFPGNQVVNDELYNQLFTMHGTIMLLLFATPLFFGFGNAVMPLQIGAPDVAFPRLNMLSYWLFLFGGLIAGSGLPDPAGRGRLRLVRLHAAVRRGPLAGRRR